MPEAAARGLPCHERPITRVMRREKVVTSDVTIFQLFPTFGFAAPWSAPTVLSSLFPGPKCIRLGPFPVDIPVDRTNSIAFPNPPIVRIPYCEAFMVRFLGVCEGLIVCSYVDTCDATINRDN
jgi:hypothetical protein